MTTSALFRVLTTTATLACLASPAVAGVELLEAGIICPRETEGALVEAPGTEAGYIRHIDQGLAFDLDARKVPTMANLSFGFRVSAETGTGPHNVTIVVTHPPMGDDGVTRQEWQATVWSDVSNLNLFTFEEAYEKVPGPWTFAVELDGEAVVSVPFDVTDQGARGSVESVCFQFLS